MPKSFTYKSTVSNQSRSCLRGIVCTKSLAIIFNCTLILNGIFLILLSVYTIKYKQNYVDLFSSQAFQASTYIILTSGALVIVFASVGIFSAWNEKKPFLISIVILLSILIVIQVAAAIQSATYRAKLNNTLINDINSIILIQYGQPGYEMKTAAFNELQTQFKCCGASDFSDWSPSPYIMSQLNDRPHNKVAESCCKTPSDLCAVRDHPSNIFTRGCAAVLEVSISEHVLVFIILILISVLYQICGIFVMSLLVRRINQRKSYNAIERFPSVSN